VYEAGSGTAKCLLIVAIIPLLKAATQRDVNCVESLSLNKTLHNHNELCYSLFVFYNYVYCQYTASTVVIYAISDDENAVVKEYFWGGN